MTLIPELRRDLLEMVRNDVVARRRRRLRRWLAGALPLTLVCTTGALAAGGVIRVGGTDRDPVSDRRPDAREGVVLPGTTKLLAVRTDDPDGGPPWSLRLSSTTRGLGCLTAGRVVGDQVGAIGAQGRFHPFPVASTGRSADCGALDANGRLFYSVFAGRVDASARLDSECDPGDGSARPASDCDHRAERDLFYGALGPDAVSVSYTTPSGTQTVPTVGPEGAYLLVLRSGPRSQPATGGYAFPVNGPVTEIRFRDGRRCRFERGSVVGRTANCALPGFSPRRERPTRAQVSAPVTARATRSGAGWTITVRFRARIPVVDAASAYNVRITSPRATRGRGALAIVDRNVARGEVVVQRFINRRRAGVHRGVVTFHRAQVPGQVPAGAGGVEVGRFAVRIP